MVTKTIPLALQYSFYSKKKLPTIQQGVLEPTILRTPSI